MTRKFLIPDATKSSVTILVRDVDDKIDKIKIKDYAKKTSLSGYILTSTFNTKSSELENKIKDADLINKSAVTKANALQSGRPTVTRLVFCYSSFKKT